MALGDGDIDVIIGGLFRMHALLTDIAEDLHAIRRLAEEDEDDGTEADE